MLTSISLFTLLLIASVLLCLAGRGGPTCLPNDSTKHDLVLLQASPTHQGKKNAKHGEGGKAESGTVVEHLSRHDTAPTGAHGEKRRKSTEPSIDVCGTRAVLPSLQLQLEIYRRLWLVRSSYARCHVPDLRNIVTEIPVGASAMGWLDKLYVRLDRLTKGHWHVLQERRAVIAYGIVTLWAVLVSSAIVSLVSAVYCPTRTRAIESSDLGYIRAMWKQCCSNWVSIAWLEPLVHRYGWARIGSTELSIEADPVVTEDHFNASMWFRKVWEEEVEARGPEHADLLRAIRRFLGVRIFLWMVSIATLVAIAELIGITMILDVSLNFLHLVEATRYNGLRVNFDVLRPAILFISFGFGVPMATRMFCNMMSLSDARYTNKVAVGLLAVVYDKCQQLPPVDEGGSKPDKMDLVQPLMHDIRTVWVGALTNVTYLLVYPLCVITLLVFFVLKLGRAAILGAMTTLWILLLDIPIRSYVRRRSFRTGQIASSRLGLMTETIANIHTIKAAGFDQAFSDRIQAFRDDEVNAKFKFSVRQSMLDVPIDLFPFALITSSLLYSYWLDGVLRADAIFAGMQTLSGLTASLPTMATSFHRCWSLPCSASRIGLFLKQHNRPMTALRQARTIKGAPCVRVTGSFVAVEDQRLLLRNLDFTVAPGELVGVVGRVGAGKSSLLAAILGHLAPYDGDAIIEAPKNVSYCAQVPWILDGTLRENVMLGEPADQSRLRHALKAALLCREMLPTGDAAEYGRADDAARPAQGGHSAGESTEDEELLARRQFPYFKAWNVSAVVLLGLSAINVDWQVTGLTMGLLVLAVQGTLHWSVLEFPLQTIAALCTKPRVLRRADPGSLTLVLNYNLLATSHADVDECMHNMLEAYMNNLGDNVSAALVSATNNPDLREYELQVRNDYRARIYKDVFLSGLIWAGFVDGGQVKSNLYTRIWAKYDHLDRRDFVQNSMRSICERYANEFMVVHRRTRVLRKCGQYQDLILLSAGYATANTYCDQALYGRAARAQGDSLFLPSADVDNMLGRHFDYTLVLDSDTCVDPGTVFELLEVGAAYPDKAIIQPAIKMKCTPEDSLFMHVEAMRQRVYDPMTSTMTTLLGRSSFFGKGLIKNVRYIEQCLFTEDTLLEAVPIDVLSHDTFEAAVTCPLYCSSVYLLEAPCGNYVTWDIRERRWNLGELLLAMYFWPEHVGRPVQWLQGQLQGRNFNPIQVRTKITLDEVSEYFAHGALRQMILKPMLLVYILVMHFVKMHHPWTPFFAVMFSIIIFPKFATCTRYNYADVILETFASLLQFTPEAVIGSMRVMSAVKAHVRGAATWVPQRTIEEEAKMVNPFLFALRYLWYYPIFALFGGIHASTKIAVGPEAMFVATMLGTMLVLPLYVGFTALPANTLRGFISSDVMSPQQAAAATTTEDANVGRVATNEILLKTHSSQSRQEDDMAAEAAAARAAELVIGSHGSRLSSGERSRVALARAAYSRRSELVLIDDPFAAVDTATGLHVLHELVRGQLLGKRTRIVTMQPRKEYLQHFDRVILLEEGRMIMQGSPSVVLASSKFEEISAKLPRDMTFQDSQMSGLAGVADQGQHARNHETHVRLNWLSLYSTLLAGGPLQLLMAALSIGILRVVVRCQMILLGRWADHTQIHGMAGSEFYIMLALLSMFGSSALRIHQSSVILSFNKSASRDIFKRAFSSVLQAPIDTFWNKQPAGRVVSRLSDDVAIVDIALSNGFASVFACFFDIALEQAYCLMFVPWLCVVPMYLVVAAFCSLVIHTKAHLGHLAAKGLSNCQEEQLKARNMRASVRAYQCQNIMTVRYCAHASQIVTSDSLGNCVKSWFVSRVTFCFCFQSTLFMLMSTSSANKISVGNLAIMVASNFCIMQQLSGACDAIAEAISVTMSLQRLTEYFNIPQEAPVEPSTNQAKLENLRGAGVAIQFVGLFVRYGEGPDVLREVNVDIAQRTRTVFMGPPGSGKSTALLSLLRIVTPRQGWVQINGVDIGRVDVGTLRRIIGLVPQDPLVFRDTVRFNIDPSRQLADELLWDALECAQLLPFVRLLVHGLDHVLTEDGGIISFGQRQLLSIARAVCQQPPLLLLDECTSSLDPRLREDVQDAILLNFSGSTIIGATRHLDEVHNYQHVVFLDAGEVTMQGPVSQLAPRPPPDPQPSRNLAANSGVASGSGHNTLPWLQRSTGPGS